MTVNELIESLLRLPLETRELPVVASMWTPDRQDFTALGDVFSVYYEGGEFVQVMGEGEEP